jgi:UPF0042 nucleotide-binding protein
MPSTNSNELLIVTGMSGAGRSTVGNALEDLGWYVVDNLPPQMLGPIAELFNGETTSLPRLAVVIDVRGGDLFSDLRMHLDSLKAREISSRVLFLDASDQSLVRRFEQVRRPHPLQADGTLLDGISTERARLTGLREHADVVIDTSDLNIHQLSNRISEHFALESSAKLQVTLMSFGFKYGIPTDADLVADVRFLPNPFWIEDLRPYSGIDQPVADYVLTQNGAADFLTNYRSALEPVLSGYQRENKRYATIAVGCTGGKHRSVAMAIALAKLLDRTDINVTVRHRDLGKE